MVEQTNAIRIDVSKLKNALSRKTCVQIAKCARVINLDRNTKKMKKEDAIEYVIKNITKDRMERFINEADYNVVKPKARGWTNELIIVETMLAAYDRRHASQYKGVKCSGDNKTPVYGEYDGGSSDCPPGYKQEKPGVGCCIKFEDVFGNQITDEDLKKIPNESERKMVRALFPKADPPRLSIEKQGKLLMVLAKDVQQRTVGPLGEFFQSLIDSTKQDESCVDSKTWFDTIKDMTWTNLLSIDFKKLAMRGLGAMLELMASILMKLGKLVMWSMGKIAGAVASVGQQLAWYVLQDPLHARMILAVCTSLRNRVADRIVDWCIENQILMKIEETRSPLGELNHVLYNTAKETLNTVQKTGILDPINVANHLSNTDSVKKVATKAAELGVRSLGGMFAMVGGPIWAELVIEVSKTVVDYSTTAAVESIKFSAYQQNVHESFWILIELFDIRDTLRRHPGVSIRYPNITKWLGGSSVKHETVASEAIKKMVSPNPDS